MTKIMRFFCALALLPVIVVVEAIVRATGGNGRFLDLPLLVFKLPAVFLYDALGVVVVESWIGGGGPPTLFGSAAAATSLYYATDVVVILAHGVLLGAVVELLKRLRR